MNTFVVGIGGAGGKVVGHLADSSIHELRDRQAREGLDRLMDGADCVIAVSHDRLVDGRESGFSLGDLFKLADDVLSCGARALAELSQACCNGAAPREGSPAFVLSSAGLGRLGTGTASGENRVPLATRRAMDSSLLEGSLRDASRVLLGIRGDQNALEPCEVERALGLVRDAAAPGAEIAIGTVLDPNALDEVTVTIVAAGLGALTASGPCN